MEVCFFSLLVKLQWTWEFKDASFYPILCARMVLFTFSIEKKTHVWLLWLSFGEASGIQDCHIGTHTCWKVLMKQVMDRHCESGMTANFHPWRTRQIWYPDSWSSLKILKDSVAEVKVTLSPWHRGIPERHNRSIGGRLFEDGKGQICTVKDLDGRVQQYPRGTQFSSLFAEALCCCLDCSGKRKKKETNRRGKTKEKQND